MVWNYKFKYKHPNLFNLEENVPKLGVYIFPFFKLSDNEDGRKFKNQQTLIMNLIDLMQVYDT